MGIREVIMSLQVVCIVGLSIVMALAAVLLSEHPAEKATVTNRLAQELRQSSDDLTRFIRTYTVTGNISYWGFFQQVIAIRNGEAPLPDEPWRNYWDLYISDGKAPRGFGPPRALRDRMREAAFTASELALLDEAQRQSDALIDLEDVAYHAMQGLYRPENTTGLTEADARAFSFQGAPNQTYAMGLVHGIDYHQWKGRIMRPLDEFAAASSRRVNDAVDGSHRTSIATISVQSVILVMLLAIVVVYYTKVAADAETRHLLSAVLPERVVESITVHHFTTLRRAAGDRANMLRSKSASVGAYAAADFPVLYSEHLPIAWVAFTDVVSFTEMCRVSSTHEVISTLNELFSLIDIAALKFKVEKIKTIGDAFMAAKLSVSEMSGIGSDDAARVAADGLDMVHFLLHACSLARSVFCPDTAGETDRSPLELRTGLNVGPCASGIVGFERPLYDLFGDTVNTAARLEASGRVGSIHMLERATAAFGTLSSELFIDGSGTTVDLKGLGTATTCFVVGVSGFDANDDSASMLSSNGQWDTKHRRRSSSTTGPAALPPAHPATEAM